MSVTVLWFKRDLRVRDHPALALAAAGDTAILPLYIAEPGLWTQPDASGRQWAFVAESLRELARDLAALGVGLRIDRGDAVEVLERIHTETGILRLVSHQETGTEWTFARDLRVSDWARARGIPWEEPRQSGVVRRLRGRDGWARQRDGFVFSAPAAAPGALRAACAPTEPRVPSAADLGLFPDPIRDRQSGGRRAGEALLASFLEERGKPYRAAMSSPVSGETACSRLSPHLAWGTLSVREAVRATQVRQRQARDAQDGWGPSLKSFQSRLAWRDHFAQKLEDEPRLETRALHPALDDLRPRDPDAARLAAWQAGETGVPFVDACMRYLAATGWLNFRMRAMVVSFASYHLWLDWRITGPILARLFTDYDPGIHWPQVQMQSGVTGMNTVRIYNPVKQGGDQDPDGAFTRTWVPELAEVPDRVLQEPWKWEGAQGLGYPPPLVDLAEAARAARDAVWGARKCPAFREEAQRLIRKHASRKDARFVNDRAPRSRAGTPDPRQSAFDLGPP